MKHICLSTNTWYIRIKKDKSTDSSVLCFKSREVHNSKLKPLYTALLQSIKLFEYRIGIKLDTDLLVVEQNNYLTKNVSVYIVYDLDAWPRNPTNNSKFNNCLFGAANIAKNSDKEKYAHRSYRITFRSVGLWIFDNDTTRNVIIFITDNSSSSPCDNWKNNFLIWRYNFVGQIFRIND